MLLSIIIPTFNSEGVLWRALHSVFIQSFSDFEVLIMDGLSTDKTADIVNSFSDERIKFFSSKDKGIYDAMNKGIEKASGEWLYFLGSDDYLVDENVLSKVFSRSLDGVDVLYGDVESDFLHPYHYGQWSVERIGYNRCHQAVFYNKKVFKRLGKYNLKYHVLADYDLNLKWFLSCKFTKLYIPITIAHYSEGGFSCIEKDEAFSRDYHRLVLLRGWRMLTNQEKQFHLYEQLNKSKLGRAMLRLRH